MNKTQEVNAPGSEIPLEQRVMQAEWLQGVKSTPLLQRYFVEIAPKLMLGSTSTHVLEAFVNVDVQAEKIGSFLQSNPYYEDMFLRVIAALGRQETPSIAAAVVLLGMQRSRNLILALQLFRSVYDRHPDLSADGKLNFKSEDYLKYALKVEEAAVQAKDRYADTAYAAGVVFDYLDQMARARELDERVLGFISAQFGHGLRAGKVGREVATLIHDFSFGKHVFATCMLHDIGKCVMAMLDSTYLDFLDLVKAKGVTREIGIDLERQKFGISHEVYGAMVCDAFQVFGGVSRAVLCHHEPYLLKKNNPRLYQLAAVVEIATNVANNYQSASGTNDAIVEKWKGPGLKDLKIESGKFIVAVNKAIAMV